MPVQPGQQLPHAGQLDRFIELRHRVLAPANTTGERPASWPTGYARVWADTHDTRGQKRFLAAQFSGEQLTEITMRYREDILETDRIYTLEGITQVFEILQIAEIGRREGLDLLCRSLKL